MQSSFNEPEDRKYFVMYFAFNETAKQPFSKKGSLLFISEGKYFKTLS